MGRRTKEIFLQRRHTDGQETHEKMLNIDIREKQIKTTMRFHVTLVRMVIIKSSTNNKYWSGCGEKGSSYTGGGNRSWYSHYVKQYEVSSVK